MNLAVETRKISKSFGRVRAVDRVDLRVEAGEIYGFLGLNGAGKTTTIRLLLGLARPDTGEARLLGRPVGPNGVGPWDRVGHMVELPSAYPELTVRENLEVARRLRGIRDKPLVENLIERLKLAEYADRRAGGLSTGNLHRLGLARALLGEPRLLILDEPANGLDPAGVVEIRELLRELSREQGVTVFMSSHVLPEVDRLAMRIGIIHHGRLIEELSSDQLEEIRRHRLVVRARDLHAARDALVRGGYGVQESVESLELVEAQAIAAPERIAEVLVAAGSPPTYLAVEQEDLEAYFLRLTGAGT